jgi:hypothetical protein
MPCGVAMMSSHAIHSRRDALVQCAFVAVTALMCAGLLSAAALVPAPPAVLPFLVLIGVGCPMVAACGLPAAIACLRRGRPIDPRAVDALRRQLDALPETQHPLGL